MGGACCVSTNSKTDKNNQAKPAAAAQPEKVNQPTLETRNSTTANGQAVSNTPVQQVEKDVRTSAVKPQ